MWESTQGPQEKYNRPDIVECGNQPINTGSTRKMQQIRNDNILATCHKLDKKTFLTG